MMKAGTLTINGVDYRINKEIAGRISRLFQKAERDGIPLAAFWEERFALCRKDGKGKGVFTFRQVCDAQKSEAPV